MAEWLPELTDSDLDTLIEALEAWESKDFGSEMIGDILDSMFADKGPAAHEAFKASRRTEQQKRDLAKKIRKERSVLLRAKLLTLRDRRRVDDVVNSVRSGD